jgi:hypothetical protein
MESMMIWIGEKLRPATFTETVALVFTTFCATRPWVVAAPLADWLAPPPFEFVAGHVAPPAQAGLELAFTTPVARTAATCSGVIKIGAVLAGPPGETTVLCWEFARLFWDCWPVALTLGLVGAAPAVAGVATPLGLPLAPTATAHAWPETAALAPTSWICTFEEELMVTGAWLPPATVTPAMAVWETSLDAVTPMAELWPELAVVMPVPAGWPMVPVAVVWAAAVPVVGPSATLRPDWDVAALVSVTFAVWLLLMVSAPLPPATLPALSWVLFVLVSTWPALALAAPLAALVAACGVAAGAALLLVVAAAAFATVRGDATTDVDGLGLGLGVTATAAAPALGLAAVLALGLATGLALGLAAGLALW